eukprot:170242-Chlamydomonas_euryale.AAC.16
MPPSSAGPVNAAARLRPVSARVTTGHPCPNREHCANSRGARRRGGGVGRRWLGLPRRFVERLGSHRQRPSQHALAGHPVQPPRPQPPATASR